MKLSAPLSLALGAAVIVKASDDHSWRAPGPNDLRSPCPGLNTLANHGFLPRNGRNITVSMILQAGFDGYHIEPDALMLAAKVGLTTSPEPETLTLDNLKQHGVIEHDASLSRQDFAIGDNLHFNEAIFETLASSNPGSDVYNITSAGQVMQARLEDSLARNPNVTNSGTELVIRMFESALYLSVMGNASAGVAPKNFVQKFFREERLPIEEGWQRPSTAISSDSLLTLGTSIAEESHWNATDECPTIPLGSA
uniref:Putative Cloroperoxidase n=1 Tax=Moniliophthora roreri TaxID=221103 RepID=A0A0W0G588_MONRR